MRKQSKSWKGLGKKGERGEKRLGMSQNWTLTKLVTDCLNSELLYFPEKNFGRL